MEGKEKKKKRIKEAVDNRNNVDVDVDAGVDNLSQVQFLCE